MINNRIFNVSAVAREVGCSKRHLFGVLAGKWGASPSLVQTCAALGFKLEGGRRAKA